MSDSISKVHITIHGIRYDASRTETLLTDEMYQQFVTLCFDGNVEWVEARDPEGRIVTIGKESLKQGIYNHEVLPRK